MTLNRSFLYTLSLLMLGLLGGCGGGESPLDVILRPEPVQQPSPAEQLEASADWLGAARAWRDQAATQGSPQREDSQLRALELFLQAGALDEAQQLLGDILPSQTGQQVRLRLALAELALARRRPNEALDTLQSLAPTEPAQQLRMLQLRADAWQQGENHLEAAQQRIALDPLLDPAQRQPNHLAIWNSLNRLSTITLQTLAPNTADANQRGWLELAALNKQASASGLDLRTQLLSWQQRYPQHPANQTLVVTLQLIEQTPLTQAQQIALLLPLEGKFSEAARAVRDGFFAAYYNDPQHAGVRLRVYDTTPDTINQAYEQAGRDGAEFIVGPLDKDSLLALLTRPAFPVPLLALNDVPGYHSPANVYHFALSPEDEAAQVAEHIWLDGRSRGIALYPQGPWGERLFNAFQQRWQQLGGELLETVSYNAAGEDFAGPIRTLLDIDESRQRHRRIENLVAADLKFEMRRRQDIDFVFFAAYPTQARQLRPQFDFYNGADLPLYTTSHVYTGTPDRNADRDMNGVVFGDMPWVLKTDAELAPLHEQLQKLWLDKRGNYSRLFAFGIDAYRLIPRLPRLAQYRFTRYAGATGSLRLDETARVRRDLNWAEFRAGLPRVVTSKPARPAPDDNAPFSQPAEPDAPIRLEPSSG